MIRGRDFSYTEQNFTNDAGGMDKGKKPIGQKPMYNQNMPSYSNMYQHPMVPGNYPNAMMPQTNPITANYGYSLPPYGQPPGNYPNPNMSYYYPPTQGYDYLKEV